MKELLSFLISSITNSNSFEIEEESGEREVVLTIKADPKIIGILIGKGGKTIKNIRKIVSVKGVLDKKSVKISVLEL